MLRRIVLGAGVLCMAAIFVTAVGTGPVQADPPDGVGNPNCDGIICTVLCKFGSTLKEVPGRCCGICVPDKGPPPSIDCALVLCAACPEGTRPKTVGSECCPICIPGEDDTGTLEPPTTP